MKTIVKRHRRRIGHQTVPVRQHQRKLKRKSIFAKLSLKEKLGLEIQSLKDQMQVARNTDDVLAMKSIQSRVRGLLSNLSEQRGEQLKEEFGMAKPKQESQEPQQTQKNINLSSRHLKKRTPFIPSGAGFGPNETTSPGEIERITRENERKHAYNVAKMSDDLRALNERAQEEAYQKPKPQKQLKSLKEGVDYTFQKFDPDLEIELQKKGKTQDLAITYADQKIIDEDKVPKTSIIGGIKLGPFLPSAPVLVPEGPKTPVTRIIRGGKVSEANKQKGDEKYDVLGRIIKQSDVDAYNKKQKEAFEKLEQSKRAGPTIQRIQADVLKEIGVSKSEEDLIEENYKEAQELMRSGLSPKAKAKELRGLESKTPKLDIIGPGRIKHFEPGRMELLKTEDIGKLPKRGRR